jgi:hypothetical protein
MVITYIMLVMLQTLCTGVLLAGGSNVGGVQPTGGHGCHPGNLAVALARSTSVSSSSSFTNRSGERSSIYLVSSNQCWNTSAPSGSAVRRAVARATAAATAATAAAAAAAAAGGVATTVRAAHERWWREFWADSFVAISGEAATRVEAMYYVNMYRYASACRYGVHDLTAAFGPGGMTMQWGGMVWDMNVQVNLFALHNSNHIGIIAPFVTAFDSVTETPHTGPNNVTVYYGNMPGPGWPLIWTLKSYWRFTSDDPSRTRLLFKLLKLGLSGIKFVEGNNSKVTHVEGIGSPEYPGPVGTVDTNFGLAISRWGIRTLLEIAAELPDLRHDSAVTRYAQILSTLAPFSADNTGYKLDPQHRFLLPHRHWSHIILIYDLELAEGRFNHTTGKCRRAPVTLQCTTNATQVLVWLHCC